MKKAKDPLKKQNKTCVKKQKRHEQNKKFKIPVLQKRLKSIYTKNPC